MIQRIDNYVPIDPEECEQLWKDIVEKHSNNLAQYSVKLPGVGTCKQYQLIYLYKFMNCYVKKDVVSEFVAAYLPDAGKDQQVRHLAADGFCVLNRNEKVINAGETVPTGYNLLQTLDYPKPQFMKNLMKRQGVMNTSDFEDVKKFFGYRCASCGAKEGEPHRVTGRTVQLQQGHMNPKEALGPGNTIPQCQYCNQIIYKDFFVFNEHGYPARIHNPEYVLRSDKTVRRAMYELIKAKDKIK